MDSLPNACVNIADASEKVFPKLKFDTHIHTHMHILLMKIGLFLTTEKLP
jgi:hypothetical protein